MLQQTRVDTVIPYFQRFLERFPTMQALALASEDEVLAAFSGLGYYRRARLLHRGVAEAFATYGRVPEDYEARRSLPGVGAYTAGAIGSIAFEREEPVVDGNVARVLSRFHLIETPLGRATTMNALWARAGEWVRGPRPGDLNQAIMELGATVCSKVRPACESCPLRAECGAHASARTDDLPVAATKPRPLEVTWSAAIVRTATGAIGLVRGEEALFGGLFGVPTAPGDRAELVSRLQSLGVDLALDELPSGSVRHVLTHRVLSVAVFYGEVAEAASTLRWLDPTQLGSIGVSRLTTKLLATPRADEPAANGGGAAHATRAKGTTRRASRSRSREP